MKLTLEEYKNWVSQELDKLLRPPTAKGKRLLDDSSRALTEARAFFEDLSRKGDRDMASKRDPVSYRAARLIGHSAREASQSLTKIESPRDVSWESLKAFKDSLSGVTRALRENRSKTVAELSGFYILDMRSFSGVNDRVAKQSERLSQFLEGDGSVLQKARTLTSILSDVQSLRGEMNVRNADIKSLTRDQELLASKANRLSAELAELEGNQILRELLELERNLRSESRHFRTDTLAHLKRPLRRLRDLSSRGEASLGIEQREALEMYIESPYRSFLSSKAGPHLGNILENLKATLSSGKMGFKPRKTTRVLTQLEQLSKTEALVARQIRGRTLLSRRRQLLQDTNCKNMYESRKKLLSELETVRGEIVESQEKDRSVKEKSNVLNKRVQDLLTLLESKTKEFTGKDVQIERVLSPIVSPG